jgi:hypothetical protein
MQILKRSFDKHYTKKIKIFFSLKVNVRNPAQWHSRHNYLRDIGIVFAR